MSTARLLCVALVSLASLRAAEPTKNESLRLEILAAIFPGMKISGVAVPVHRIIRREPGAFPPIDFPDALAGEKQYSIAGEPANETEMCAAKNMSDNSFSRVRELQFKVFLLPSTHDAVAVLQYSFAGANPGGNCWSIGRLVRLAQQKNAWRVTQDRVLEEEQHHSGLEDIKLSDIDGDGLGELIVDTNSGGAAGVIGSSLEVYSLREGQMEEWLRVTSRYGGEDGAFEQKLDVAATRATRGQRFCFQKFEYAEAGYKILRKPKVSAICYSKFEGVERR